MKYNKIVNENDIKNKNTFLIACVCSIMLLLTMCYFGINTNIKGTAAASTCDGEVLSNYCCPTGYTSGVTSTGLCYNSDFRTTGSSTGCLVDTQIATSVYEATTYQGDGYVCTNLFGSEYSCEKYGDLSLCSTQGKLIEDDADILEEIVVTDECNKDVFNSESSSCAQRFGSTWKDVITPSNSAFSGRYNLTCYNTACDEDIAVGTFYTSNAGGSLVVHATTECTIGSNGKCTLPVPASSPSLSGWTFQGWSIGAGCSGFNNTSFEVSANTSYYACFIENDYDKSTIVVGTFKIGDEVYATKTCQYKSDASSCSMPLPTAPTKDKYTFTGWGDSDGCTSGNKSAFNVSNDVTKYACWQENSTGTTPSNPSNPSDPGTDGGSTTTTYTYKANFNANGGTLKGNSTKSCTTSGSSCYVSDLPTASKDGYTFKGWGTGSSCTSGKTDRIELSKANTDTTFYACYANNSNNNGTNVDENPKTGEITMALVWFAGIFAIAYSVYYFKQVREN